MNPTNDTETEFAPEPTDADEDAGFPPSQPFWTGPEPPIRTVAAERVVRLLLRAVPESSEADPARSSDGDRRYRRMQTTPLRWPRLKSNADPAIACAMLLLHRLIRETLPHTPDLHDRQIIVLEVPAEAWIRPVWEAWRTLMAGGRPPTDPERVGTDWGSRRANVRPGWIMFPKTGYEDVVSWAAVNGIPILGISAAPDRLLPTALVQAADLKLRLPRADLSLLRRVARMLTGTGGETSIDDDRVRGVVPETLRLARRAGQSGDDWLKRVFVLLRTVPQGQAGATLRDLSGMDDVVKWGTALARDLVLYRAGSLPWSSVDRGALLAGPPGVGKTTAAAAIARTCAVPLISTSYSEWQSRGEGHLGHVTRAIRDTFARARALAPAILFIDELDTVRGRAAGGYRDDWWSAITNCLLEELDGLSSREGVVVVAATNFPRLIDDALLRAGRLDRVIIIPPPNAAALDQILRFHLRGDLADADLSPIAERMEARGATGAEVERAVRDARRRAREAGREITIDDLLAQTVNARTTSQTEKWLTAVHEAGHAIAIHLLAPNSLAYVSVRERGDTGGSTALYRNPDTVTRTVVENRVAILLSGRVAEELLLGAASAGAGGGPDSDLARATDLATQAIASWGLGRGAEALRWHHDNSSPAGPRTLPATVDRQINRLLKAGHAKAQGLLRAHRGGLIALAEHLLAKGEMEGAEVHRFLDRQLAMARRPRARRQNRPAILGRER